MTKFGYIINDKNIIVDFFKLNTKRAMEFEYVLKINLAEFKNKTVFKIKDKEKLNSDLIKRIEYYLSIRNNENPDYGIDWKGRFEEKQMFNCTIVIEKEMNLFNGNEDNIIAFLANIQNQLKNINTHLSWFLTENHKEQREFLKTVANKV